MNKRMETCGNGYMPEILLGDNLPILKTLQSDYFDLIYVDLPLIPRRSKQEHRLRQYARKKATGLVTKDIPTKRLKLERKSMPINFQTT